MKKLLQLGLILALTGAAVAIIFAQAGPMNALNLPVITDSNNALFVSGVAASGTQNSPRNLANTLLKTDSTGGLVVTVVGGTMTPTLVQTLSAGACVNPITSGYSFTPDTDTGIVNPVANEMNFCVAGTSGLSVSSAVGNVATNGFGFYFSGSGSGSADVKLDRSSTGTLDMHNGTSASVFRIFNSRTSTSNYRDVELNWSASDSVLQASCAGATACGNLGIRTNGNFSLYLDANNAGSMPFTTGWQIDTSHNLTGLGTASITAAKITSLFVSTGSGMAVANVGANSCGTTAATIAGNNNAWVITVGATSGTQCRVAFTVAAPTEWDCAANDDTTTIAVRVTPVDTTHTDVLGTFTAGDKVSGICFPR